MILVAAIGHIAAPAHNKAQATAKVKLVFEIQAPIAGTGAVERGKISRPSQDVLPVAVALGADLRRKAILTNLGRESACNLRMS